MCVCVCVCVFVLLLVLVLFFFIFVIVLCVVQKVFLWDKIFFGAIWEWFFQRLFLPSPSTTALHTNQLPAVPVSWTLFLRMLWCGRVSFKWCDRLMILRDAIAGYYCVVLLRA